MLFTIIVAQKFKVEEGTCFSRPCFPELFEVSSIGEHDYTNNLENDIDAKEAELRRDGYKILGYADNYDDALEIAADNY